MRHQNITPDHFTTAVGDPVLQVSEDGTPSPVCSDSPPTAKEHVGEIALALYMNAPFLDDKQIDDVIRWIKQYRRG